MGRHGIPSLMPAIGMGSGIWLAYALQPDLTLCTAAFLLAASMLGVSVALGLRTAPWLFTGLVLTAFTALGSWVMAGSLPKNQPDHYLHLIPAGQQQLLLELGEPLKPTTFSRRWTAEVRQVGKAHARGKVLLQLPIQSPDSLWLPGDRIRATGRIAPPRGPMNPHQFNYAAYLKSQGIYGQLRLDASAMRHTPSQNPGPAVVLARLRKSLLNKVFASTLSGDSKAVLAALVLGDRTRMDPVLYQAYQRAGAAHLLAVSGLHVGVLMGLAAWMLKPLARTRGGSVLRLVLILLCLWTYAALAGFSASVVRASVLFSFIGYAHLSGRGREGPHLLGLAALVMLGLINPYWLFQPGFQLSFAAVWAIYAFYPAMMRWWPWKQGPGRNFGELFCVGNAAQLGVLPISLYYFHQFPLLFWAANLCIVPFMGAVLGLGFALVACLAAGWFPSWPAFLFDRAVAGINAAISRVASLEAGLITGIPWSAAELVLLLGGLLSMSVWLACGGRWQLRLAACCLLALQGWQVMEAVRSSRLAEWVVPHRTGASGIWVRNGTDLRVYSPDPGEFAVAIRDYKTGEGIGEVYSDSLKAAYFLGGQRLWILGPEAQYPVTGPKPDILLLRGSPKVHLDRALQALQPGLVIADGSNYRSFAKRWAASCKRYGIPFHHTAGSGAYRARLEPVSGRSP